MSNVGRQLLPGPVKVGLTAFSIGGIGGVMYFFRSFMDSRLLYVILIALAIAGLAIGIYVLFGKWRDKRRDKVFSKGISAQRAPRQIKNADEVARLDSMRKRFLDGINVYRKQGRNLYGLPWFLIAGEPGAGKTEFIRKSGINFPQDTDSSTKFDSEFEGVGGTVNMSWWFTNEGVILDTAGKVLFPDVEAGSVNEWEEFLKLLRKYRKHCPINGLILTIPADKLLSDSLEETQEKARQIAKQFGVIQASMGDLRFPVYVVLTKCDKIGGFRELFRGVNEPKQLEQIFGWSNPAELDDPFNPAVIDRVYGDIVQRVREHRQMFIDQKLSSMVRPSQDQFDEIAAMYAFPSNLERLQVPLKHYIEKLFSGAGGGYWDRSPLFFRGLYITSSLQEGAALDAALAEALGESVESFAVEGFTEKKTCFTHDFFFSKVFREKGLVTWAKNAGRQLAWNRLAVVLLSSVSIVMLLAFTLYGAWALHRSIGSHYALWAAAGAPNNWETIDDHSQWRPLVVPLARGGTDYIYQNKPIMVADESLTTSQLFTRLYESANKEIEVPYIFSLASLGSDLDEIRQEGLRILCERGILLPIVGGARRKMVAAGSNAGTSDEQLSALRELMRLEFNELNLQCPGSQSKFLDIQTMLAFLLTQKDLERYQEDKNGKVYQLLIDQIYAKQAWPPPVIHSSGPAGESAAVRTGVDGLFKEIGKDNPVENKLKDVTSEAVALVGQWKGLQSSVDGFVSQTTLQYQALTILPEVKTVSQFDAARQRIQKETATTREALAGLQAKRQGTSDRHQALKEKLAAIAADAGVEQTPDGATSLLAQMEGVKGTVVDNMDRILTELCLPQDLAVDAASADNAALQAQITWVQGLRARIEDRKREVDSKVLNDEETATIKALDGLQSSVNIEFDWLDKWLVKLDELSRTEAMETHYRDLQKGLDELASWHKVRLGELALLPVPETQGELGKLLRNRANELLNAAYAYRLYTLYASALESRPRTLDELSAAIALLTTENLEAFNAREPDYTKVKPAFHPYGAKLAFQEWAAFGEKLQALTAKSAAPAAGGDPAAVETIIEPLDAKSLQDRYTWAVHKQYLDEFRRYWFQIVPEAWEATAPERLVIASSRIRWPEFPILSPRNMNFRAIYHPKALGFLLSTQEWVKAFGAVSGSQDGEASGKYLGDYLSFWIKYADCTEGFEKTRTENAAAAGQAADNDNPWIRFHRKLAFLEFYQIAEKQRAFKLLVESAFSEVDAAKIPDEQLRARFLRASENLTTSIGHLEDGVFRDKCTVLLMNWTALGTDMVKARQRIIELTPAEFVRKYMFTGSSPSDFVYRYWQELSTEALQALSQGWEMTGGTEICGAVTELNKLAGYPLVIDGRTELASRNLQAAHSQIDALLKFENLPEESIGGGARGVQPLMERSLDSLRVVPSTIKELPVYLKEMKKFLPPSANMPIECKISLLNQDEQQRRMGAKFAQEYAGTYWQYIRISQGSKSRTLRAFQANNEVFEAFWYPGEPLRIELFTHDVSSAPDVKVVLPGEEWSGLRLLQAGSVDVRDGVGGGPAVSVRWEPEQQRRPSQQRVLEMQIRKGDISRTLWLEVKVDDDHPLPWNWLRLQQLLCKP